MREVEVAVPFTARPALGGVTGAPSAAAPVTTLEEAIRYWQGQLGRVGLRLAAPYTPCLDALRTAAGYFCASGSAS